MTHDLDAIAERLIDAFSRYDADALVPLLHPDVRHWVNVTEEERGFDGLLEHLRREARVVSEARYTMRARTATEHGMVLQFAVDGVTKGGATFRVPACLVLTLADDGRISRIDEYADIQRAKDLIQEMYAS